ncbi:ribonuclease J, partial [Candidatus Collierbacteria bacterium CG10_big_fil_rev_8_21_14_0_10_43_36]
KIMSQLKLIPLGGVGGVTKNMYVYEFGDDQIVVDCGMGFPSSSDLGVDSVIPDISYLEKPGKHLHGIILTHPHMDHIGGLPYILPRLKDVEVFGGKLAIAMAEVRVREFGISNRMTPVEGNTLDLGPFHIELIHSTHSVPNCFHLLIKTPAGTVYHGADFKFDLTPVDNLPPDMASMAIAGRNGVDLMLTDCLGIEKEGFCPSERSLKKAIDNEIRDTQGKLIFTGMSSSISRFQMAIESCIKHHRRVAIIGRSVEQNLEAAIKTGFIKIPAGVLIKPQQIATLPANQVAIIVSGSQGQSGSAMHRLANNEHRLARLKKGDKVIISSNAIPGTGNDADIFDLMDTLYKNGIDVTYSGTSENLHVSGHGYRGDIALLAQLVRPKYIIPIGGDIRHMMLYKKLASDINFDQERVFILPEGQSVILEDRVVKAGPKFETKNVYVDGLGIGDVGTVVLRDRQVMSEDGILLAIVPIKRDNSQVAGNIEIISRGFVYQKESQDLILDARKHVLSCLRDIKGIATDWGFIRKKIEGELEKFAFEHTQRRPMVIAIVIEV